MKTIEKNIYKMDNNKYVLRKQINHNTFIYEYDLLQDAIDKKNELLNNPPTPPTIEKNISIIQYRLNKKKSNI